MGRLANISKLIRACARVLVLGVLLLTADQGRVLASDPVAVSAVRLGLHGATTRFVAEFSSQVPYTVFTLADPYRVVIDVPALDWAVAGGGKTASRGVVGAYRYGLFRPNEGRLVLDLSRPARIARTAWLAPRDGHLWRLLIDLDPVDPATFLKTAGWPASRDVADAADPRALPAPAPKPVPETPAKSRHLPVIAAIAGLPSARDAAAHGDAGPDGVDLPVVVIDPGHGGIDPGASAGDGTFEKDVVLDVALQLASALRETQRYEVRLTRADDTFLKLKDRVDFARHAKADLFISLHADALASNPKVGGLSVYTLSENASDKEAEALASKENRADVIGGVDLTSESDDVTMILIDLAQRETMNQSIQFAHSITNVLKGDTRMVKNGIRQAGFRVLKAPDVCSVLIELGYLSNAADLKRITSETWRAEFADGLAKAVDQHFALYGEQRSAWRQ